MSFGSSQASCAPRRHHLSWYCSIEKLGFAQRLQTRQKKRAIAYGYCVKNENLMQHILLYYLEGIVWTCIVQLTFLYTEID